MLKLSLINLLVKTREIIWEGKPDTRRGITALSTRTEIEYYNDEEDWKVCFPFRCEHQDGRVVEDRIYYQNTGEGFLREWGRFSNRLNIEQCNPLIVRVSNLTVFDDAISFELSGQLPAATAKETYKYKIGKNQFSSRVRQTIFTSNQNGLETVALSSVETAIYA